MHLNEVWQVLAEAGFTPRGAFAPTLDDGVPDLDVGVSARTVVLVGNAGPAMWDNFVKDRDPNTDKLDDWTFDKLTAAGRTFCAIALFPFTKPHLPFQRWAQRAEACHISPLGLAIHADYGVWHAYRGALAFAEEMDLPPHDKRASPCDACVERPCLSACPVSAFTGSEYKVADCARHLASTGGSTCMARGCLARHACPVGREFAYEPNQAAFLMAAYLRGRREDKVI
jgi:hypothetical protein